MHRNPWDSSLTTVVCIRDRVTTLSILGYRGGRNFGRTYWRYGIYTDFQSTLFPLYIKACNCVSVLDNTQLPYLEAYKALTQGFKQGSYSIIVQPCNDYYTLQEYIFDVHHPVDFLIVNVWQQTMYMCLLQMYLIVQAWHIYTYVAIHACILLLSILIHIGIKIFISVRKVFFFRNPFLLCCVYFCLLGKIELAS